MLKHRDSDAARLDDEASAARRRLGTGKSRVQAQWRDRDPEAVRAHQAHAVAAADGKQLGTVLGFDPGGHHDERSGAAAAAVPSDRVDARRRHGDHGQIRRLRQISHGGHAGHAQYGLRMRVDGVDPPAEASRDYVSQDRVPDPAWLAAGADHSDRFRRQQVAQAGHVSEPLPHRHRVQVRSQALITVVRGQREGGLDDSVGHLPARGEPYIGEDPEHGDVVGQRLGGERAQTAQPRSRDEMFEQERGDSPAVHVIGDREGDLSDARFARWLIARDADELIAEPRQQRAVIGVWWPGYPLGLAICRLRADAEKAQVDVARRHLRVHLPDGIGVLRPGRPDQHGGAIGE